MERAVDELGTAVEDAARAWSLEDALAVVTASVRRLDEDPNHQARAAFRAELERQSLSWRWTHWSVEDLQRVAVILQEGGWWTR